MAYKDFTLESIESKFGVTNRVETLVFDIKPIQPSVILKAELDIASKLPKRSEKSRSENIVSPVLKEVWRNNENFFTIYSGEILDADKKEGLYGECDFIITKTTQSISINLPILTIVEAKKNDLDLGIPQCGAQLIGAQVFNNIRKRDLPAIYGCVTTGDDWIFMKLVNKELLVDLHVYDLKEIEIVLGVFQGIIDYYKILLQ